MSNSSEPSEKPSQRSRSFETLQSTHHQHDRSSSRSRDEDSNTLSMNPNIGLERFEGAAHVSSETKSFDWKSELATLQAIETNFMGDAKINDEQSLLTAQIATYFHEAIKAASVKNANNDHWIPKEISQSGLTARFKTTAYEEEMESNNLRIQGTCEWLCTHTAFCKWLSPSGTPILVVSADAGCGKSVLSTHLIKTVLPMELPEAIVCYFFFKQTPEQAEIANVYSALLHQLFTAQGTLAAECRNKIESYSPSLVRRPQALWSIFSTVTALPIAGPMVCVIDALDEGNNAAIKTLISDLQSLYKRRYGGGDKDVERVKFLITTRGYPFILDNFKALGSHYVHIDTTGKHEIEAIEKEIDLVVQHRLSQLARAREFSQALIETIRTALQKGGSEARTYLWVKLIFEVLEREYPINDVGWETLVSTIPRTTHQAYQKLLGGIAPSERNRVLTLLSIIIAAHRPLTLAEMNIALAVREMPGMQSVESLKLASDQSFRDWIISTCGFLVLEHGGSFRLIHQTAKEFLLGIGISAVEQGQYSADVAKWQKSPQHHQTIWQPVLSMTDAHAILAESCISYLSLGIFRSDEGKKRVRVMIEDIWHLVQPSKLLESADAARNDSNLKPRSSTHHDSFLSYCVDFWNSHFHDCQVLEQESLISDIGERYWPYYKNIFEDFYQSSSLGVNRSRFPAIIFQRGHFQVLIRHFMVRIPTWITLQMHFDLVIDRYGDYPTPLSTQSLVSFWGHVRMAQLTAQETLDTFPLFGAVFSDNLVILNHLHSQGFSINSLNSNGESLLHWAVKYRRTRIVQWLLSNGAELDQIDRLGFTPLLSALRNTHHSDISNPDGDAYIYAVKQRETVARMLVEANSSSLTATDANSNTALHLAVQLYWGHRENYTQLFRTNGDTFIEYLVKKGADMTTRNFKGESPLELAFGSPYFANTECLLRCGADPNSCTNYDLPIIIDCIADEESATLKKIELLLRFGADVGASGRSGNQLLHIASARNMVSVVSLLLNSGARIETKNDAGQTPISFAMERIGSYDWSQPEPAISMLLANGANPNERDIHGRTLLHLSSLYIRSYLTRSLIEAGASVMARDRYNRTPLHCAILSYINKRWGDDPWIEKNIRCLIWHGASIFTNPKYGQTPMDFAWQICRESMTILLPAANWGPVYLYTPKREMENDDILLCSAQRELISTKRQQSRSQSMPRGHLIKEMEENAIPKLSDDSISGHQCQFTLETGGSDGKEICGFLLISNNKSADGDLGEKVEQHKLQYHKSAITNTAATRARSASVEVDPNQTPHLTMSSTQLSPRQGP